MWMDFSGERIREQSDALSPPQMTRHEFPSSESEFPECDSDIPVCLVSDIEKRGRFSRFFPPASAGPDICQAIYQLGTIYAIRNEKDAEKISFWACENPHFCLSY
jgi:hypothetical protein